MKTKLSSIFHMVRTRMILLFIGIMAVMLIGVIFLNSKVQKQMYEKVYETNQELLAFYAQRMEEQMDAGEALLVSQRLQPALYLDIERKNPKLDNYLASYHIYENLRNNTYGENIFDYLFVYAPSSETYIECNYGRSAFNAEKWKTYMMENVKQRSFGERVWELKEVDGRKVLVYVLSVHDSYIGGMIDVESLLQKLTGAEAEKTEEQKLQLYSQEEMQNMESADREEQRISEMQSVTQDAILVKVSLKDGSFCLMNAIPRHTLTGQVSQYSHIFLLVMILLLILAIGGILLLWKTLIDPLSNIVQGMKALKEGRLDYRLQEDQASEFAEITDTFNEMSREIWKLKIDIYEEQLSKQKAQLAFLQNQLNPHFLINCLNDLRFLEMRGEHDRFQAMIQNISTYMRNNLNSKAVLTLEEELQNVENYIHLQQIRYQDQFAASIEIPDVLYEVKVPSQLLQCFAENALKYQMNGKKQLQLEITADFADEECETVQIEIKDNGDGFSEEILDVLNRQEQLYKDGRRCVGIYNIISRLNILYPGKASVHFCNAAEGGAVIRICIPMEW